MANSIIHNMDGNKQFENIDILIRDIQACKSSLEMLLAKIENEQFLMENQTDWTTILNSLRIVSTNLISISKFIKDKKEMTLKTYILVPKQFSEDVDPELKEMTNNRISVFNQDLVPNILRTKLIPQLEENETKSYLSAKEFESIKTYEKNINQFKKSIEESEKLLLDKPKRDIDLAKQSINTVTYNIQDTWTMISTIVNPPIKKSQKYF